MSAQVNNSPSQFFFIRNLLSFYCSQQSEPAAPSGLDRIPQSPVRLFDLSFAHRLSRAELDLEHQRALRRTQSSSNVGSGARASPAAGAQGNHDRNKR